MSRATQLKSLHCFDAIRRNITDEEIKRCEREAMMRRGREYNAAKPDKSKNLKKGNETPNGQNDRSGKPAATTGQEIAKKHGVSEKTIRRDAVRAELHDTVQEADPKAAELRKVGFQKSRKKRGKSKASR